MEYGNECFESDLALERRRVNTDIEGIEYKRERAPIGIWERITVRSDEGAENIGRPKGIYDTLTLLRMDKLTPYEIDDAVEEVAKELCLLFESEGIRPGRLLVVGLGNGSLTPDAVGPRAAEEVYPTLQIEREDREAFEGFECSEIAVLSPNVSARSGMEAAEIVRGVCKMITPDAVIAIDALASRSPERLGTTIQLSTTGIFPSSGLGKHKLGLTEEELGVPVIAVGVPTVISSDMFLKGIPGISGKSGYGMLVSPKDIDGIVNCAAKIIGGGINQAFGISY